MKYGDIKAGRNIKSGAGIKWDQIYTLYNACVIQHLGLIRGPQRASRLYAVYL